VLAHGAREEVKVQAQKGKPVDLVIHI